MFGRSAVLVGVSCLALGLGACRARVDESLWEEDPPDGTLCGRDGECDELCRYDPDCGEAGCGADGVCRPECATGTDPDCAAGSCGADGACNPACAADPDCEEVAACASDGRCDPACADDPDCAGMDCSSDGACSAVCPEGWDPDCAAPTCGADGRCEPRCPAGTDPDCSAPECGEDRWCNPACAADPDCRAACGYQDGPCCTSGAACDGGAECVSVEGGGDMCLTTCTPTVCATGGGAGSCLDLFGGGTGACFGETLEPSSCVDGETGCTTPHGTSTGTVCIGDGWESFCLESCALGPTGCDSYHQCIPFMGAVGLGACISYY